jgi:hypothetical protein
VCQDVADELARIGRQPNLTAWTDGAIASVTMDMLLNVANGRSPWELGGSLLDVASLPRSTRYRHRAEGTAYLYHRRRREAALRDLVAGGRSPTAARAWLRRHPGEPVSLASPPQRRRAD